MEDLNTKVVSRDQLKKGEDLSQKCVEKNVITFPEAKEELSPSSSTGDAASDMDSASSIGPITPNSNRESAADFLVNFASSPLSSVSSPPPKDVGMHQVVEESIISTPKESVFDPFATTARDELMLAPKCNKYYSEEMQRCCISRRLNFESSVKPFNDGSDDAKAKLTLEEETLLETVYETLLEAIVSKQTEGPDAALAAEIFSPPRPNSDGGSKTPISAPRLSGFAETCPRAPMKRNTTSKLRNIDQGLCRKLEF